MSLYNYKKNFFKAIAIFGVLILMLYIVMSIPLFYNILGRRLEDMIEIMGGDTSGQKDISRQILITYGIQWFLHNPILGYGMNCFRVLSNHTLEFAGKNFYAHNNYIELLVGGGVLGFSVYYSYVFILIKKILHHSEDIFKIVAIILSILLFMDFAEVSYYDAIMQILLLFAFILINFNKELKITKI